MVIQSVRTGLEPICGSAPRVNSSNPYDSHDIKVGLIIRAQCWQRYKPGDVDIVSGTLKTS